MSIPRSVALERTAYLATAPVLAAAANIDSPIDTVILIAGAAGGAASLYALKNHDDAGRKVMRLSPLVTAAAIEVIANTAPGWGWDTLIAAGWAAVGCMLAPLSRTARSRFRPALAHTPAPAPITPVTVPAPTPTAATSTVLDGASTYTQQVRLLWEHAGNPANTIVHKAFPHDGVPQDLSLMLKSAEPGRPIASLTHAAVAAAFGVDETDVRTTPVVKQPGREGGPGWLEVHITPDANARRRKNPTDSERWADKIGAEKGAIPGSEFATRMRDDQRGVTHYLAHMTDKDTDPRVDLRKLAKALDANYDDGRVFCDLEDDQILVSVWDTSPLAKVYEATRELLTPDSEGRWITGYLGNGQPARNRVYTDRGAAHGLFVAPSGGGKTQLMALGIAADANYGACLWLATEAPDEKTLALGQHTDHYGVGSLYMVRLLRALDALMEIRGEMPWEDGQVHEWSGTTIGCPYPALSSYLDEFLSAARDEKYGAEVMDLAERVSVKGRKYGIGIKVAGQSIYVQDGFTQLLRENLRENSIPVVLKVAAKKVHEMFSALGVAPEHTPEPLPRSFSPAETGRLDRILNGEPEPPANSNTGGVGWIIEHTRPEVLRTLFMDFSQDIAPLFPEQITRLTDHEIAELDKRGLWGDWNRPDDDLDGEDDLDDWDYEQPSQPAITTASDALAAINRLTHA